MNWNEKHICVSASCILEVEMYPSHFRSGNVLISFSIHTNFPFAAQSAAAELGIATSNPNAPTILKVVANTPTTHHVVVCTLCSCYPTGLLGFSPAWYKSRAYRSRVVREPRRVLAEFGLHLPSEGVSVTVLDSTADLRYLVLPLPPAHLTAEAIRGMTVEELRQYVTRDSMIGVAVL